ncbi:hypothetical protein [Streptosporangium sp. NPDC003464]
MTVDPDALHSILRALPRERITTATISEETIARWYRAEDDYRKRLSAIAELHQPTAEPGVCSCGAQDCQTAELARGFPSMAGYIEHRAEQLLTKRARQ